LKTIETSHDHRLRSRWQTSGLKTPQPGRPIAQQFAARHAGHYRLVTDNTSTASVERYLKRTRRTQPLSQPQPEALAIVAYAQPVSRARIE